MFEQGKRNSIVEHEDNGQHWPQVLAILFVCLGPFTSGMLFTWTSPFALVIVNDKINYDISEEDVSLFLLFQPIGMILTSLVFFKVSELLGRKKTLIFLALPHILCWLVTIFAKTKWDFYVARFIAGMGDAVLFGAMPPYVGEISTPIVRDYCGNLPTFVIYCGQLFITVIGSYFDVQISSYICIGFPILYVILICCLPESPYQLIKDGKFDEAKRSIGWFQRRRNVESEFSNIKADVERQISESGTLKDLFLIDSNRKALRAGVFLRLSQQFAGISVFATYTQTIFQKAGGNLSPQYSSIIFVSLVASMNLICSVFVAKLGRRPSYFFSLLSSGFVLLSMAVYFFLDQYNLGNLNGLQWFPLAGMITYVFTYSVGLSIVPTLMLGELFSASVKSKGLGVLILAFGLGVLGSVNMFHVLTANFGLYSSFLVFAIVCFVSTFLTLKWVPETKGKTLEEIQQLLKLK